MVGVDCAATQPPQPFHGLGLRVGVCVLPPALAINAATEIYLDLPTSITALSDAAFTLTAATMSSLPRRDRPLPRAGVRPAAARAVGWVRTILASLAFVWAMGAWHRYEERIRVEWYKRDSLITQACSQVKAADDQAICELQFRHSDGAIGVSGSVDVDGRVCGSIDVVQ